MKEKKSRTVSFSETRWHISGISVKLNKYRSQKITERFLTERLGNFALLILIISPLSVP